MDRGSLSASLAPSVSTDPDVRGAQRRGKPLYAARTHKRRRGEGARLGSVRATGLSRRAHSIALDVLSEVLGVSDACGVPRKMVGARLGLRNSAVYEWFRPGRRRLPYLVELLLTDVLPAQARERLLQRLAERAGMVITRKPMTKVEGSLDRQVLTLTGDLGTMAQRVRESLCAGGDGGKNVTPAERARMKDAATEILKHAAGLLSALE